jgi:serine/threonine-protein kinase
VVVAVSNAPAPRIVPAIVDLPEAQGLAELGRSGVGLGTVTASYVAGREPGIVLSTDPVPGTAVPRASPVNVVVSGPPETLTVPSVTGLLQASASSIVSGAQLSPSIRNQTVPAGDARAGRVISQSLPGGTPVAAGTPLQLVVGVAAAPPTTTTTVAPAATTTVPAR